MGKKKVKSPKSSVFILRVVAIFRKYVIVKKKKVAYFNHDKIGGNLFGKNCTNQLILSSII